MVLGMCTRIGGKGGNEGNQVWNAPSEETSCSMPVPCRWSSVIWKDPNRVRGKCPVSLATVL